MSYLALYRRYRPDTFDKLIGQEHIVKTLVNQIENDRLGHAYLFTGTRGTGKTSAAKIFAKAVNCEHPVNGSPCGKCAACLALSDPSNIDVMEIDAASNNGVNEIRELREKVQYPPVAVKYKVYIVDEVHMLTGAAFNALLKTLEEPPRHAIFILATTEAHKIPATILSRCMRFDFKLIPTERIAELIAKIYDEEGKKYEKEAVFAIAKAGEGSIRDALSIADIALSYGEGTLTYKDVTEILGSSGTELIRDFTEKLLASDTGGILEEVDSLASLGKSMGVLTRDVTAYLRDLLVVKTCKEPNKILGLPEDKLEELKKLAANTNDSRILRAMEVFADAETALKYTTHPRVVFETAAIKAALPQADLDTEALVARIKAIEDKLKSGAFTTAPAAYSGAGGGYAPVSSGGGSASSSATAMPSASATNGAPVRSGENGYSANAGIPNSAANSAMNSPAASAANREVPAAREAAVSEEKPRISETDEETVKGKLLTGLRKSSEMLWSVMQNVPIKVKGSVLTLRPQNAGDFGILDMKVNAEKIKAALSSFAPFELVVEEPSAEKKLSEVDEASEKLKKLFGEDIVVIKY